MANKKFLITFLGLAVLLQLSFAVPIPDDDSKPKEASDAKVALEASAASSLGIVAAKVVPKEIDILKEVVKDLKDDDNLTEDDESSVKDIEHLLKKYEESDKDDSKLAIEFLLGINVILDPPSSEHKEKSPKISELVDKHGWKAVREILDAEVEPKIDEVVVKLRTYNDILGAPEKEKEKELVNWLKKYDDKENDVGDKLNLLLELIAIDDSDEEN